MSSITTEQGILHYEVFGRGKPVILLHGWLGSWGLWRDTMAYLGQYFRTYALDFWGFGESGRKRDTYTVADYVSLVNQFMDQLGIARAPLVGHSMGGTVSLLTAIQHPERVSKVVVIGSPITGGSLSPMLKLFGCRPVATVVHHNLWALKLGFRVLAPFYSSDRGWADMMDRDIARTTLESFLMSISSLRRTDVRPRLGEVRVPVMGMYGDRDIVVHPEQWRPLEEGVAEAHIERFSQAGHFIMMDEPRAFQDCLRSFLADAKNPPPSPLPLREGEKNLPPSPLPKREGEPESPAGFAALSPDGGVTGSGHTPATGVADSIGGVADSVGGVESPVVPALFHAAPEVAGATGDSAFDYPTTRLRDYKTEPSRGRNGHA